MSAALSNLRAAQGEPTHGYGAENFLSFTAGAVNGRRMVWLGPVGAAEVEFILICRAMYRLEQGLPEPDVDELYLAELAGVLT